MANNNGVQCVVAWVLRLSSIACNVQVPSARHSFAEHPCMVIFNILEGSEGLDLDIMWGRLLKI